MIKVNISEVPHWSQCEAWALASPRSRPLDVSVAAWVGMLAHALVAGRQEPQQPVRLVCDSLTPVSHQANVQARAIAQKVETILAEEGVEVKETEKPVIGDWASGRLDILAWHPKHGYGIIDLKTGSGVGASWLQVGGYIAELRRSTGVLYPGSAILAAPHPLWGGILHVPRVKVGRDTTGSLAIRDGNDLTMAYLVAQERIQAILDGAPPTYSPGVHCARCQVAGCPVRA